jgi:hypothetical protein
MTKRRSPYAFAFQGTMGGVPVTIRVSRPVKRSDASWSANVESVALRINQAIVGASASQARTLAFGILHALVAGRELLDDAGRNVRLPGTPLAPSKDVDDGRRSERGVAVCLVLEGNGKARIVMDDVRRVDGGWMTTTFFTHRRVNAADLMKLPKRELEEIGLALVSRLVALSSVC